MLLTTLLLLAIPAVASFEIDPHYFVYPNRPEHFIDPKVQRRSLLPFLKVRDLPMSGLVYLNRIKPIGDSSEEETEDKKIGAEIDTVVQTLKDSGEENTSAGAKIDPSFPTPSPTAAPFPQPQIPFPWQRGIVQPDQTNPQFRVRSAPTQFVHQPVVGSAFVQSQYPHYPYPILPQELPQLTRDESSGDELTVVAPSLPLGSAVGQNPSSVQLLPVEGRRILHSGSPHLNPLGEVPFRAHGIPTHNGPLSDNKLVSISVFRLGH
ncbi:hypothetical protein PMAYCL1PPCAC_23293 [Pristionchus mayeri]|uniref:Uncharacterized protein n=1 Tax=Pristionchus mayeri TaxID=1317129 RepID=A0AAN5I5J7_9BILA|nr:hypothetical protein PMAYCL1PPCAC_23293 [Pristionchus mayeri]